jgi:hypothetical protein
MSVVLADVVPELVEQPPASCDSGRDVTGVVTDVTSSESVEALATPSRRTARAPRVQQGHRVRLGGSVLGASRERLALVVRRERDGRDQRVARSCPRSSRRTRAVVNTTSGNVASPTDQQRDEARPKAAVTTLTECLWGQLRGGFVRAASLLYPSTRTPGR